MRRRASRIALVALSATACDPRPVPRAPINAASASAIPSAAPVAPPARPTLRLEAKDDRTSQLVAKDAGGATLFEVPKVLAFVTDGAGDTWAMKDGSPPELVRLAADGTVVWSVEMPGTERSIRPVIGRGGDRVVVADVNDGRFWTLRASDGAESKFSKGRSPGWIEFVDDRAVYWSRFGGSVGRIHPEGGVLSETAIVRPSADPLEPSVVRALTPRDGGGAWVASSDGAVTLLDDEGKIEARYEADGPVFDVVADGAGGVVAASHHEVVHLDAHAARTWRWRSPLGAVTGLTSHDGATRVMTSGVLVTLDASGKPTAAATFGGKDTAQPSALETLDVTAAAGFEFVRRADGVGMDPSAVVVRADGAVAAIAAGRLTETRDGAAKTTTFKMPKERTDRGWSDLRLAELDGALYVNMVGEASGQYGPEPSTLFVGRLDLKGGQATLVELPEMALPTPMHVRHAFLAHDHRLWVCVASATGDAACNVRSATETKSIDVPAFSDIRPAGTSLLFGGLAEMTLLGDLGRSVVGPDATVFGGSAADDLWLVESSYSPDGVRLLHGDGKTVAPADHPAWKTIAVPAWRPTDILAKGPSEVWIGADEGLSRFDGTRWKRLLGAPHGIRALRSDGAGHVFALAGGSVYEVVPAGATPAIVVVDASSRHRVERAPTADDVVPNTRIGTLVRATVTVTGGADLAYVRGARRTATGALWLSDDVRTVEWSEERATPRPVGGWAFGGPGPIGVGADAAITPSLGHLEAVDLAATSSSKRVAPAPLANVDVGVVRATAASPSGVAWLSDASDRASCTIASTAASATTYYAGLPPWLLVAIEARADGDVWFAGGRRSVAADAPFAPLDWPVGDGALVHFDGTAFTAWDVDVGALLAVSSPASGDAWAVGVDGAVIHVSGATPHAYRVRGGAILRAVVARSTSDVWMVGDDAAVIHFDGKAFTTVSRGDARPSDSFTAVFERAGEVYVGGPSGVFRVALSP